MGVRMDFRNNGSLLSEKAEDVIVYLLIVAALACECSLFFLSFLPNRYFELCNYTAKYLNALVIAVGFAVILLLKIHAGIDHSLAFGVPVGAFVVACLLMSIVSWIGYGTALRDIIVVAMPFVCIPLLYFELHGMVRDNDIYEFFIKTSIIFATIYAIVCIAESLGASIMNEEYLFIGTRNGRLRIIVSGDFVSFGALLSLGRAFSTQKNRALYATLFAVMFFELYWVAQTRLLLFATAVAAVFGFIISGKNRKIRIRLVIAVSLICVAIFFNEIVALFFPSDLDISGQVRVFGYSYYLSHGFDLGLFGLGYIPPDSPQAAVLDMGTVSGYGMGDITDIGIVGYLARYGICGVAVLVIAAVWFVRAIAHRNKRGFSIGANPEAWMVLTYFIVTSPTMAITDAQRIFYLPVLALLVEHALVSSSGRHFRNQRNNEKKNSIAEPLPGLMRRIIEKTH